MTITHYQQRTWLDLQNPALELANAIASTDFVPTSFKGNPAAITAAILYGDEVGLGPMMSLAKIAVINGRPTLAAEAQRALILQAGHDLWIEESTTTKCTVAGRRRDSDATSRITWTMDDAKRAGIAGKQPWRMYPRQMLLARASAELARAVFPDSIGGLAATEELAEDPDALALNAPGNGAAASPPGSAAAPTTKRRRRANVSSTPPVTTPEAPAPTEPERPPLPGEEPEPPPALPDEEQQLVDDLQATLDAQEARPPPEPPSMDDGQRKNLMRLFRENGFNTSEQRHAFSTFLLGRPIASSIDIKQHEADHLIQILEQRQPASE